MLGVRIMPFSSTDMLRYGAKSKEIISKIDKENLLNLKVQNTDRLDLFIFAMALGHNAPTEFSDGKEALIRGESVRKYPDSLSLMSSIIIGELNDSDNVDEKLNRDYILRYAENCANTGFLILADLLNKDPDMLDLQMLSDLDDLYEKYIKSLD